MGGSVGQTRVEGVIRKVLSLLCEIVKQMTPRRSPPTTLSTVYPHSMRELATNMAEPPNVLEFGMVAKCNVKPASTALAWKPLMVSMCLAEAPSSCKHTTSTFWNLNARTGARSKFSLDTHPPRLRDQIDRLSLARRGALGAELILAHGCTFLVGQEVCVLLCCLLNQVAHRDLGEAALVLLVWLGSQAFELPLPLLLKLLL